MKKKSGECFRLFQYCQTQRLVTRTTARTAVFRLLTDVNPSQALQVFHTLAQTDAKLEPWVVGRALDAATRLRQAQVVSKLCRDYLSHKLVLDKTKADVFAVLQQALRAGDHLNDFALASVVVFAERSGQRQLAHDATKLMKTHVRAPTREKSPLSILQADHKSNHPKNTSIKRAQRLNLRDIHDASGARILFQTIQTRRDVKVSPNIVSTLLTTMAKHRQFDDCLELFRYVQEQNVALKPFALLAAFSALCEAKQFEQALLHFDALSQASNVQIPWVYGWALTAATSLHRPKLVADIFRRLLSVHQQDSEWLKGFETIDFTAHKLDVSGMLQEAHDRGVSITEFALRALVDFADKTYQSNLVLDAVSMMQDRGITLSSKLFSTVLKACGKNKRWSDVLDVFEIVPEDMYMELSGSALGSVLMALTKSGDDELIEVGLAIFDDHPFKWVGFACNAALVALLETKQFEKVLPLANEMKSHGLKWSPFTYRMVVLAQIRTGFIDEARNVLRCNAQRLQNESAACYEQLVHYYAQTCDDAVKALECCQEMLQWNWHIDFASWCMALELTHQLPDHPMSWQVRKQLWLRVDSFHDKIPYHLLVRPGDSCQGLAPDSFLPDNESFGIEVFRDIRAARGANLTDIIATRLLETMANYDNLDKCREMLDYFNKQGVHLKPTARIATFKAFCVAKEDVEALKVFKTMVDDDLVEKERNLTTILIVAIEFERADVVTHIIKCLREQGIQMSHDEFERVEECFRDEPKWRQHIKWLSTLVRD
ncbi:hypothetical protein PsorP6_011814 [Peronosclerospora sorghi]|uniref:Uncharacterized protein n=1 Tax=Peronosclerospora sorghi TaxID=230839 RepID=A0ACC0WL78_9STRA|nr:hypothetical protein PsorP6_011814 [Peronosclerospora sorghi]